MPVAIDRDARAHQIYQAAIRILSERGPEALTLRNLAEELGGSITLVTHVFPDRASLMKGITAQAIEEFDLDLAELEVHADDRMRLRLLLEWMLPVGEQEQRRELARVMLVSYRESDLNVSVFFVAMDKKMRQLLRDHLKPFRSGVDLDMAVETLRILVNGVVLATAEHPGKWPRKRILALLNSTLRMMNLD